MTGDILARLQAAESDEEREWLVMQFSLETLSPALRQAVWAAAIPHYFDGEFLGALLDKVDFGNAQDFRNLLLLSFVEAFEGRGYNVHERSRALLLRRLWDQDRGRYRELSRRAAAHCAGQEQGDTGWRVEGIYHGLLAGQEGAAESFVSQGIDWHNGFEFEKVEALVRPALQAVEAGRLAGRAAAWAYLLQARLDVIYNRYTKARENLELALDFAPKERPDQTLRANCIKALGDVHLRMSEYGAARQRYEDALPIFREIGSRLGQMICFRGLGDLDRQAGEWAAAEEKYRQALAYYEEAGMEYNAAFILQRLGHTAKGAGDRDRARSHYQAALERFQQIGSPTADGVKADLEGLDA